MNDIVPKTLYRGYKVKYKKIQDFHLSGVDLKLPYAPLINEYGEKVVSDGNEYGVYMSDNLMMVEQAYGDTKMAKENVEPRVTINNGFYSEELMLPVISVIYQINTEGLSVRKPKISSNLKGHYNNGFVGDEYIADMIPADHYQVIRVKIGPDFLHDAEEIPLTDILKAEAELKKKAELRKYRLELLANSLSTLPKSQKINTRGSDIEIFRAIFGENGIRFINPKELNLNNNENIIKFLYYSTFNKSGLKDLKSLKLIQELQKKIKEDNLNILDIINEEIINLQAKSKIYLDKKGVNNPTILEKIDILENFKKLIKSKKRPYLKKEVIDAVKEKDSNKIENNFPTMTKEQLLIQKEQILKEKQKRVAFNDEKLNQAEVLEEEQGLSM